MSEAETPRDRMPTRRHGLNTARTRGLKMRTGARYKFQIVAKRAQLWLELWSHDAREPVAGQQCGIMGPGLERQATTDAAGRLRLRDLAWGVYQLSAPGWTLKVPAIAADAPAPHLQVLPRPALAASSDEAGARPAVPHPAPVSAGMDASAPPAQAGAGVAAGAAEVPAQMASSAAPTAEPTADGRSPARPAQLWVELWNRDASAPLAGVEGSLQGPSLPVRRVRTDECGRLRVEATAWGVHHLALGTSRVALPAIAADCTQPHLQVVALAGAP